MEHFAAAWPDVDYDDYLAAANDPAAPKASLAIMAHVAAALTRREDWAVILSSRTKDELHRRAIARGKQYADSRYAPMWLATLWTHRGRRNNARLARHIRMQRAAPLKFLSA